MNWYKRADNFVAERIRQALLQAKIDPGLQVDVANLEIDPLVLDRDFEGIISTALGKLPPEPLNEAQENVLKAIRNQVTGSPPGQAVELEMPEMPALESV